MAKGQNDERGTKGEGERGNGEVGRGMSRAMSFRPELGGVEESLSYWTLVTGNWTLRAFCAPPSAVSRTQVSRAGRLVPVPGQGPTELE